MDEYKAYIKIANTKHIEEVNDLLYHQFEENVEITWDGNIANLIVFDKPSFHYILKKIYQLLSSDLGINLAFLIVPKFDKLFIKYLNQIDNDVYSAFELFLKNINQDYVVEDAKSLLKDVKREYLTTASVFLKCNLNNQEAAKELYLHRNSFAYRLNIFIKESKMNIKEYATAQFLSLLFNLLNN